jgi:hypothetical protein
MIRIDTPEDWGKLRREGLLTVLDPLTFRTAETFLRGAPPKDDETLWAAISKNVDALAAFVDALMVHDKLPVFDYYISWDPGISGDSSLVELVNGQETEALVDVHVGETAYLRARDPAVAVLRKLPAVDPNLAQEVREELSTFDYMWRPELRELGPLTDEERAIASFRYGALLFHYYAESISDRRQRLDRRAEHVLHSKRARIMLATSLAPDGSLSLDERRLMSTLRKVEQASGGDIAAVEVTAPTFLPYLLAKEPRTPGELIRTALRERESRQVANYREWRRGLLADLADGRVRPRTRRDLTVIAREIQRRSRGDAAVSLHLSYVADWKALAGALTGNPLGLLAGLKLGSEIDEKAIGFRLASILPGRGFRRLVTRLVLAQDEYHAVDMAVRNLWYHQYA